MKAPTPQRREKVAQDLGTLVKCALKGETCHYSMRKGWLKHAHVPHRTNDNKILQTIRFRNVLTMVLDGVRFLELWGRRRFSRFEKVGLNMHEGPNTSTTRGGWLGMKSKGFRRVSNFTWTQFASTSICIFREIGCVKEFPILQNV